MSRSISPTLTIVVITFTIFIQIQKPVVATQKLTSTSTPSPTATALLSQKQIRKLFKWKAPEDFSSKFPYEMTGFARENPVWVLNFGKWDVRKLFEGGNKTEIKILKKYTKQMYYKWYNSVKRIMYDADTDTNRTNPKPEVQPEGYILINDFDGYSSHQILNLPTFEMTTNMFRDFYQIEKSFGPGLLRGIAINLNFPAMTLWHVVETLIGDLAAKFHVYGTNEKKWKPALLKEIPRDALPPKLGGLTEKEKRRNHHNQKGKAKGQVETEEEK